MIKFIQSQEYLTCEVHHLNYLTRYHLTMTNPEILLSKCGELTLEADRQNLPTLHSIRKELDQTKTRCWKQLNL